MIRQIVHIDEEKCNGCGACARACHESAIGMVNGKAKLLRDDYCDGMGDCLPQCPTGAITFEKKDTVAYDRVAVEENMQKNAAASQAAPAFTPVSKASPVFAGPKTPGGHGCPGSRMREINRDNITFATEAPAKQPSALTNWPPQIKLAPLHAPYFDGAKLLIAADCSAFSYGAFHQDFIKGKTVLFGCPKLDMVDYSEKLTQIIAGNDIKSVTIVRMEVPCCGGLEMAAKKAIQASGKFIPWQVVTIGIDGTILD